MLRQESKFVCMLAASTCRILVDRFSVCFVAERYILQQKCLKKWIGSCLLGTRRRRYNF